MKIYYILTILLVASFTQIVHAQTPAWSWARTATDNNNKVAQLRTDPSGNILATGWFTGLSLTFPSDTTITGIVANNDNALIAKYDPIGNLIWANKINSANSNNVAASGRSICSDLQGNVYVTGDFSGDSAIFGSTILYSSTGQTVSAFTAKYSPSGQLIWARNSIGKGISYGQGISADASGNVYVTGVFNGDSILFGAFLLQSQRFATGNIFLVKYDNTGQILWARTGQSSFSARADAPTGISIDPSGNITIAGNFASDTLTFGTHVLVNTVYTQDDMWIARYDPSGNPLWAKSFGGIWDDDITAIATDASGNVYATGYFDSPHLTLGDTTLSPTDSTFFHLLVIKFDPSGNPLWAHGQGNGRHEAYTTDIALDGRGGLIISGAIANHDSIQFGRDVIMDTVNYTKSFVAKFDTSGHSLWGLSPGNVGGDDYMNSVCTDWHGGIFVGGHFGSPSLTFDSSSIVLTLDTTRYSQMYVAAIHDPQYTGVAQISKQDLSVYPNPTDGILYVKGLDTRYEIAIYDMLGAEVARARTASSGIDISTLSKGIYVYRISGIDQTIIGQGKVVLR